MVEPEQSLTHLLRNHPMSYQPVGLQKTLPAQEDGELVYLVKNHSSLEERKVSIRAGFRGL